MSIESSVVSAHTAYIAVDEDQDKPIESVIEVWDLSATMKDGDMVDGDMVDGDMAGGWVPVLTKSAIRSVNSRKKRWCSLSWGSV